MNKIKGYPQDKGQYDELIQFWLNYWKDQGLISEDIDPLEEAKEANVNIAAGTRWLIYKITTSPWKAKSSKKDRMYGEEYANKIFKLYEKSKN